MKIWNYIFRHLVLLLILCPVLISCNTLNQPGEGLLKGKISIGPICPVDTDPPSPNCQPTMETYKAWSCAVWKLNKKTKVALLLPNLDGIYELKLPVGNYIIDFESTQTHRIGSSNLPSNISIVANDTTYFNVDIDTGIR